MLETEGHSFGYGLLTVQTSTIPQPFLMTEREVFVIVQTALVYSNRFLHIIKYNKYER